MKILALESSAKAASCAVLADGELLASAWQAAGLTHSRTLLPMVEGMLKNSELTMEAMDAVAVAAGPGSFTGLRIGIAAVKGLAWAAESPVSLFPPWRRWPGPWRIWREALSAQWMPGGSRSTTPLSWRIAGR